MRGNLKKDLIEYIKKNNYVCPKPDKWNELWEILPGKERVGTGWNPALPLILAAWWDTSESQKNERLIKHINYAEEKGILVQVDKYLRSLSKEHWLHRNEI